MKTLFATFTADEIYKLLAAEVLKRHGSNYCGTSNVVVMQTNEGEKMHSARVEVQFDPANNINA